MVRGRKGKEKKGGKVKGIRSRREEGRKEQR